MTTSHIIVNVETNKEGERETLIMFNHLIPYEDQVKRECYVLLGDVAGCEEVLQRLQESASVHRLIVVEAVISWL